MERVISFVGLLCMVAIAFLLSADKKKINWKTVISGVVLQMILGLIILKSSIGHKVFETARATFQGVLNFTNEGSMFIFGSLADSSKMGFVFFTMVLPTIIFMSALMSILYHLGIMQVVIKMVAKAMVKIMGTSGAESLAAAANIFAGQTEAPLVIRPFVSKMTKSEIMALMTGGMATVAGGVLAAYVGFGIDAGHLLAASVMSAPAALVCAKLLVPETEESLTQGDVKVHLPKTTANLVDAAASGAGEGMKLAINVGAMLLAFIALIAMVNGLLSLVGGWFSFPQLSLELITGYLFWPVAWLMGIPAADCMAVGSLLGKKLIINEFVAYLDLKDQLTTLSPRSVAISTYALCGFANFSSIAIQVGGIGTIAPDRRTDLALLGVKSLIGGTLACLMTACIAGIFL
ncbi:MAG: NupC/NupG family nucleoside CNT transporter [Deltaproteobacteria bacterium]|nr:MAG: NupC/NupG family nucleoside CNT transporter [Deltaproteobacteria bacterium]TNF29699.1 MAG: NupC/NupG family nucleoside CNT transporter [Deltaproteobacteria bacterium]